MKSLILKVNTRGTTLVELMLAGTLLTIISLGFVGVFGNITKSLTLSKSKTLAANLAQEQMQILKQRSFNRVLVTTASASRTDFTPNIPYDTGYYPPESILEGGIQFTRLTHVQVADENSGFLNYYGTIPDTGMKAITVTVIWTQGNETKNTQVRSILANPDTTMDNAVMSGLVTRYGTTTGIAGASVVMAENMGYRDNADSSGSYTINLSPGNYTMNASARGYFSQYLSVSILANQSLNQPFSLVAMASGTIRGSVWINDHLVISQVVGSKPNSSGFCQEYVEVFNPSTYTWTIASNPITPVVDLKYQRHNDVSATTINMNYNTLTVAAGGFYLFANTSPVSAVGVVRTADAVFNNTTNPGYPDLIYVNPASVGCGGINGDADSVSINWNSSGNRIDQMGWQKGGHIPEMYEGSPLPEVIGLQEDEQYVRFSSTSGVNSALGPAYDSGDNSVDFVVASPMIYPPHNSSDIIQPVVAGVPAIGAYVTSNDGLSQYVKAFSAGSPPYAEFNLTSVATGTWNIFITSAGLVVEISSAIVTANSTTWIPNGVTSSSWPVVGYYSTMLTTVATQGYVSGWARDAFGLPITVTSLIRVQTGASYVSASGADGSYFLPLSPGTFDIIANSGNLNTRYISVTSQTVVVSLGVVSSNVNFTLSQGGRISGFATRDGINPLAGVSFVAFDANDVARDQDVSASDGRFTLNNLSTGTYSVEPVLGSGEVSNPNAVLVSLPVGGDVFSDTFTITGSFGSVRGNVTYNGAPIQTGVLILASTTTASTPPTLSATTLTGAGYYIANSYEDGTYVLDVRGSTTTTYNVYGFYTTFNGSTPSTTVRSQSTVSVIAGASTSGINFSW